MRKFLLLTLLAVLFTAVNVPSSSAAFYDIGSTGNSWEDAYVIASPEDMTLLRDRINAGEESEGKYYKLNADISLTDWQAIGSFTGHLDGQNHTLTINGTQGLFDEITVSNNEIAVRNLNLTGTVRNYGSILASKLESGIIENCKLEDVTLSGTSYYTGGIVRLMSSGTIRNCSVKAIVSSSNYDSGGIVGNMWRGTIEGCTLEAGSSVSAAYNSGGIVGYMEGGSVKGCTISEGIRITASNDAGGIAGISGTGTSLEDCRVNAGAVITASDRAGGIVGEMSRGTVQGCNVAANTSITGDEAGGIAGNVERVTLTNCTVSNGVSVNGSSDAGGIAGYVYSGSIIEGCVVSSDSVINASGSAGGITSYVTDSTLMSCTLGGGARISSQGTSGGIAGSAPSDSVLQSCDVMSGVTITGSDFSGGIVGNTGAVNITGCNAGASLSIISSGTSGGIAGMSDSGTIENCAVDASASITGSDYAGGVVGNIMSGTLKDCSVAENSSINSASKIGGIAGSVSSGDVEGCTLSSDAAINASDVAGGIVGSISAGNVTGCNIAENVSITSAGEAGGIAGSMLNGDIDGCTFGTGLVLSASNNAGGVVGNIREGNVKNCSIESGARISASENAGGIAGTTESGTTIESCDVKSSSTVKASMKAGGIVGNMAAGNITNCALSDGNSITSSGDVGGIVGTMSNGTIDGCTIGANVSLVASDDAGGIVGNMAAGNITNCALSDGNSITSSGKAGGIVGIMSDGTIDGCTIGANVSLVASDDAGGIVGNMAAGNITNCTISGGTSITSSGEAGGIVGTMSSGTIDSCTVKSGTVLRASGNAGGIAGNAIAGTIRNCTVEDGTRIAAPRRMGGIVGNSNDTVVLEGNNWPSSYSDIGRDNPQLSWNGHTYQVFNENLTWERAKLCCESSGGHLVTITSSLEQEQVENLLRQSQTPYSAYWIGAKANASGWLEWVTDEVLEKQYDNFADGQPDGSGIYVHVMWDSDAGSNGKWDDPKPDAEERGYICEWDEEPQEIEAAPETSDFQRWQQDPEAWGDTDSTIPAGSRPTPIDTSHLSSNPPNVEMNALPVSYDARNNAGLPPVRNQGIYETCWAFAALGAMETDYMTQNSSEGPVSLDLSELHLAWFAYKDPSSDYFITNSLADVLNKKGNPDVAISLLNRTAIAPVNEEDMPYSSAGETLGQSNGMILSFLNGRTTESFMKSRITLLDVNELSDIKKDYVNDTETINNIKQQILEHGAVYFSYVNAIQGYSADYSTYYSTNANEGHHAALLVGWDDNYPAENFRNNPQVNGAWLVRTSRWIDKGTGELATIGDDDYGCFWMSYAQAGTEGGITEIRSFSVQEERSPVRENGSSNHTKDITSAWAARIFQASRNEKLVRISFHTTDNNMKYQLFVNNFGKKAPTDPGHAENPLASGDIGFAGYHTVSLSEGIDLYEGDYYSVIIKMTSQPTSNYRYPTAVEASLDKYIEVSVNEGESFFADGDAVPSVWQDGISVNGGPYNACIMTFSEERVTYDTAPTITTSALANATVGQPYSFALTSSGTQTIEWRSGNIPDDFTLSREGLLTGEPKRAGQYEIYLTALNDVGYEEKSFTLTVNAAANAPIDEPNDTPGDTSNDKPEPGDEPGNEPEPESEIIGVGSKSGCDSGAGNLVSLGMAVLVLAALRGKVRRK